MSRSRKGCSLQGLVKMLPSKHLNKDNDVRLSGWNWDVLKDDQVKYAVLDAVAGLYVAASLKQKEAIHPIPAGQE
jgi:ribonuclease D